MDTPQPDLLDYKDIEAASHYFEAIKGYAKHEDGLLNNRVNWCLLFNSFLFTALAVLTAQINDLGAVLSTPIPLLDGRSMYAVAALSIASTGFVLTISSAMGVYAATMALAALEECWQANRERFANSQLYPNLLGAGQKSADRLGNAYPLLLIATLLGVWLAVFVMVIVSKL